VIDTLIRIFIAYPIALVTIGYRRIKWAFQKDIETPEEPIPEDDRTFDRRTMSEKEAIVKAVAGPNFKTMGYLSTISMQEIRRNNIEHRKRMDDLTERFMMKTFERFDMAATEEMKGNKKENGQPKETKNIPGPGDKCS